MEKLINLFSTFSKEEQETTRVVEAFIDNSDAIEEGFKTGIQMMVWKAGSQIWISNGRESETITLTEQDIDVRNNKATFSTTLSGNLYGVYPASAQNGVKDGKIGIKIPTFSDGSLAKARVTVAEGTRYFIFKNAVSVLKIETSRDTKGIHIAARSNISGDFMVTYGPKLTVEKGAAAAKGITLFSADEGLKYVAIAPGPLSDAKFTIVRKEDTWATGAAQITNEYVKLCLS